MLDPTLWAQLEAHGLLEGHLTLLLDVLQLQRNGSLTFHFVHGRMTQAEIRVTMPARSYEMQRVGEALEGASVVRERRS